jgi:hypothetical protein
LDFVAGLAAVRFGAAFLAGADLADVVFDADDFADPDLAVVDFAVVFFAVVFFAVVFFVGADFEAGVFAAVDLADA